MMICGRVEILTTARKKHNFSTCWFFLKVFFVLLLNFNHSLMYKKQFHVSLKNNNGCRISNA